MIMPGLAKQEYIEFQRHINSNDADIVTIQYETRKPNDTNDAWQSGIPWKLFNIRALHEIINELTFSDSNVGNIQFSKSNFRVRYNDCDFHGNEKRNIKIICQDRIYPIDKVIPFRKIGKSYLCWLFIEK